MKLTPPGVPAPFALGAPASGVTIVDSGGFFGGGPFTLEEFIALLGAGTTGPYLTIVGGGKGTVQSLGSLGATETIDLANANYFAGTLNADCAISTTGWTNLKDCQIVVELTGDGVSTPTFAGVTWIGLAPGIIGTGNVVHVVLLSRDGGTTIYGAVVGGSADPATATQVWMPLTTVVAGVPELVWDADNSLIPTLVPV